MRYFHSDYWGKHLVIWTDHRPICESFKNPDLQLYDPITINWMNEIGMHTHDIRYVEAKNNVLADALSRPHDVPLGEAYKTPETIHSIDRITTEMISLESIRQAQQTCPDVDSHKKGEIPKNVKMDSVKFEFGDLIP